MSTARIADLVAQLLDGWRERVENTVYVQVHTPVCLGTQKFLRDGIQRADGTWLTPPRPGTLKHRTCPCPARTEIRAATVRQQPVLAQLAAAVDPATSGADDGGARRPTPESRPPGSLEPAELLGDIAATATRARDDMRTLLDWPRGHAQPLPAELRGLVTLASHLAAGHPETVRVVGRDLARLIRRARILLGYETPQRTLRDTVCGTCGGDLIVAEDASSDVRCVGTPDTESCGTVYRRHQWPDLLNQDT